MKMRWDVDSWNDLPIPGIEVGSVHRVIEVDVMIVWTGYYWERLKHSVLDNDEEERHLPPGFLDLLIPDVKVSYVNQYELVLDPIEGGSGAVFVGGDLVIASPDTAVFSDLKALNLVSGSLVEVDLVADTEYWVYLANTKSTAFNRGDWDYRGKLFLSGTTPVDGYLGAGIGQNARLAGHIQTTEDGEFARELDISLISNRASLPEAFREFSDFVLDFIDESTIRLRKIDGTYGQIFVPDSLRYIGFDYDITRTDDWIEWDDDMLDKVIRRESSLSSSTVYYIYVAGMVDAFNFNETNPRTGRPWQESDYEAEDNYVSALDFRIKPFLSPQVPDHGRMSETWPGFYTRHIGQVVTDENGKFINSRGLSTIRQPVLNPTYFDGLAEITFVPQGEGEFRICKIRGTSGIVNVGGEAVQTYDQSNSEQVHKALNTAIVQAYNEAAPTSPLSNLNAVSTYTSQSLYLYLANSRSLWGSYVNKIFFSTTAPAQGYLSANWPGNQARWIATVRINSQGKFTGSYIEDAVRPPVLLLDDAGISPNEAWSSQKINAEFQKVYLQISAQSAFDTQKTQGCAVRLEYYDETTVKLFPQVEGTTIVFPDLTSLEIPETGVSLDLDGTSASWGTVYYVYLDDAGLYISETMPDTEYSAMKCLSPDAVLVGYLSTGGMPEEFTGITFSSSSDFTRRDRKGDITNWVRDSANKGHFTDGSNPLSIGVGNDCPLVRLYHSVEISGTAYTIIGITGDGSGTDGVELDGDPSSGAVSGVYAEVVDDDEIVASGMWTYDGSDNPSTSYATQDMTSNTSPSPVVVSSYPASSDAHDVFDQNTSSGFLVSDNPTWGATDIYYDAGEGNGLCINKWRIRHGQYEYETSSWITGAKLYGSNVASPGSGDWTLLDTQTFSGSGVPQWTSYFTFTNSTSYRHTRCEITGVSGAWGTNMWELHLVAASRLSDPDLVVCCSGAALQTDASLWSHICNIARGDFSKPSGSSIFGAFSFDNKSTWKTRRSGVWTDIVRFNTVWQYHDGTSWQSASEDSMIVALEEAIRDSDNQLSWTDIEAMDEDDWSDTNGFETTDNYFDFAVGLKPDTSNGSPSFEAVTGFCRIGHKHMAGTWNIFSFWNEPNREWYETVEDYWLELPDDDVIEDITLDTPGFFYPSSTTATIERTGGSGMYFNETGSNGPCHISPLAVGEDECTVYQIPTKPMGTLTLTITMSPTSMSPNTIYHKSYLNHEYEVEEYSPFYSWPKVMHYENVSGALKISRDGN